MMLGASLATVLAIAGLCSLGSAARWVWFVGWLAVLPYVITQVNNRYTLPLAASSLMIAGGFLDLMIARCIRVWDENLTSWHAIHIKKRGQPRA